MLGLSLMFSEGCAQRLSTTWRFSNGYVRFLSELTWNLKWYTWPSGTWTRRRIRRYGSCLQAHFKFRHDQSRDRRTPQSFGRTFPFSAIEQNGCCWSYKLRVWGTQPIYPRYPWSYAFTLQGQSRARLPSWEVCRLTSPGVFNVLKRYHQARRDGCLVKGWQWQARRRRTTAVVARI